MTKKSEQSHSRYWRAYDEAYRRFRHLSYVTGIDVGLKFTDHKRTGRLCIRVHVKQKIRNGKFRKGERIPKTILGVPTDVLQANYVERWGQPGYIKFEPDRIKKHTVIRPGISLGDAFGSCGTLGLIVRDIEKPSVYGILTAAHVLPTHPGDPVFQPARFDNGYPSNKPIAKILRKHLPMDVAVAWLNTPIQFDVRQFGSNVRVVAPPPFSEYLSLSLIGKRVHKSGRTTAMTTGIVDGFGTYNTDAGTIQYGVHIIPLNGNPNNIEISYGGDSGAVWYDDHNRGIGVTVGGETSPHPAEEFAIAAALPPALHYLKVQIL